MNKISLTIISVVIIIVAIFGIYLYSSNLNDESSNIEDEWAITMDSLPASTEEANCAYSDEFTPYSPYASQEEYFATADYILTIKVLELKENIIDDMHGKRDMYFEILNWEKGELSFIPKKLRISTDYNPSLAGVEGDTPFGEFREGESYKVHLEKDGENISFLGDDNNPCISHGIIKL